MVLKTIFFILFLSFVKCQTGQDKYLQNGLVFCMPVYLQKNFELMLDNGTNSLFLNSKVDGETVDQNMYNETNLESADRKVLPYSEKLISGLDNVSNNLLNTTMSQNSKNFTDNKDEIKNFTLSTFRDFNVTDILNENELNNIKKQINHTFNFINSTVPSILPQIIKNFTMEVNKTNTMLVNQTRRNSDSKEIAGRQNNLISQLINFVPSVLQNSMNTNVNNTKKLEIVTTTKPSSSNLVNKKGETFLSSTATTPITTTATTKITITSTPAVNTAAVEKVLIKTKEEIEQQKIFDEFFGSRQNPSYSNTILDSIRNRIGLSSKNYDNLKEASKEELKLPKLKEELVEIPKLKKIDSVTENIYDLNFVHSKLGNYKNNDLGESKSIANSDSGKKIEFETNENKILKNKEKKPNVSEFTEYKPKDDYVEDDKFDKSNLKNILTTEHPFLKNLIYSYRLNNPNHQIQPLNILPYANLLDTGITNYKKLKSSFKPPYQHEKTGYNYPIYGLYRN